MSDLQTLQQTFAVLVARLLDQAVSMGYTVTLGEAYRTPEQAAWDVAHGTGIAHSLHTERLAIDLNLFRSGAFCTLASDYEPLGEWWCQQHPACRWGGHFARVDADHFSVTHGGRE